MENELYENDLAEESYMKYGAVKSYKDLIVWQKGMLLVKEIYIITKGMPDEEKFGLTGQIRRAAISIPSNIAEGLGRKSKGSYVNHLKIANGSLCETEKQLLIIEMLEFLEESKTKDSKNLLLECSKMLKSIIDKLESQP